MCGTTSELTIRRALCGSSNVIRKKMTLSFFAMKNLVEYLYLGIPTWCLVNGTYGILYILVDRQPEGYTMSSYLVLCLTLGNIVAVYSGLFCEAFLYKYLTNIIFALLWFGLTTSSVLALFWHTTVGNLSLPLFLCFFFAGACAATSNVVLFIFVSMQMMASSNEETDSDCSKSCTSKSDAIQTDADFTVQSDEASDRNSNSSNGEKSNETGGETANETVLLATGIGLGTMTSGLLVLFLGLVLEPYSHIPINTLISLFYVALAVIYARAILAFYRILSWNSETNVKALQSKIAVDDKVSATKGVKVDVGVNTSFYNVLTSRSSRCSDDHSDCYNQLLAGVEDEESKHRPLQIPKKLPCIHRNLLILMFVTGVMGFGIIPSIISTVCALFSSPNSVLFYATSLGCLMDPFGRMHTHYYQLRSINEFYVTFGLISAVTGTMLLFLCLPSDNPVFHSGIWCALPAVLYIMFIYLFGFLSTSVFNYINDSHRGELYIIDRAGADEVSDLVHLLTDPADHDHKQTIHDLSRLCSVALQGGALVGTFASFSVFLYLSS